MALSQILILVIGIMAIGYFIGQEFKTVGAGETYKYTARETTRSAPASSIPATSRIVTQELNSQANLFSMDGQDYFFKGNSDNLKADQTVDMVNFKTGDKVTIELKGDFSSNIRKIEYNANAKLSKNFGDLKAGTRVVEYEGEFRTLDGVKIDGLTSNGVTNLNALEMGKDYPGVVGMNWGPLLGQLGQGLVWAGVVYGVGQMIIGMLPEKYKPMGDAIVTGIAGGIMAGKLVTGGIQQFASPEFAKAPGYFGMTKAGAWGVGVGAAVGIGIFLMMYKETSTEIITFDCKTWDAPLKGEDCELCNKQELPCSEYQCRSLGQACQLVNDEDSGEQMCVWNDKRDANPPEMKPWEDALLDNYQYRDPTKAISPPDRGTKIFYRTASDGCIPAFTPLSFGIETDEPAKCKLDYVRKDNFENMQFYFGGSSTFKYNHSQVMSLPGPSASENITIQNDGNFEIYTRCMDANGNSNTANFVFQFCVDEGPDMTPPVIVATNLLNDMPVTKGTDSIDIEVYTNEPATCSWAHDKELDYEDMTNKMQCSSSVLEMNAQMLYTCKTTLTGLEDLKENIFYFSCKDQPFAEEGDRNSMAEGYKFTVIGTQELYIDSVAPENGTIKGSTDSIKVTLEAKTSAGFNRGESTCYYSETGEDEDYVMFLYDTDNNMANSHKQDLFLTEGSYEYFIKCVDLGGNSDVEKVEFDVETDNDAPIVVRAFHIGTYLTLTTDEDAECFYDVKDCLYDIDDGTSIDRAEKDNEHFLEWNTDKDYYIKCKDEYNNRPSPNQCSIVVRAFDMFEKD